MKTSRNRSVLVVRTLLAGLLAGLLLVAVAAFALAEEWDRRSSTRWEQGDARAALGPEALAAMRPALRLQGDPERGEALFRDLCARCHRAGDVGGGPGPDLSRVGNWSPERVLHDVLEPNAEVDADYPNHVVETVEGEVFSGLLAESPNGDVVLRTAGDTAVSVPAGRIREVRRTGLSMMPEGLLAGLEPAAVADLLAFLRPSRQGRRR